MNKKLNIGCGKDIRPKEEGWDNLDACNLSGVNIVHDLDVIPYPIKDNTYDYVECQMVLEHLKDWVKSLEEIWRIAKPGAIINIEVPFFASYYQWTDPTHRSAFTYQTWEYFTPEHTFEYYTKAKFNIKSRYIRYSWNRLLNCIPAFIFNIIPTFYSRYLCFIFPSNSLEVQLEVIKKEDNEQMDVSIILPVYNPDEKILKKVLDSVNKQKFNGRKEVIFTSDGIGLADNMNRGIKKANNNLVVTLHQDCVPSSEAWLKTLVEPFKENDVVASCSTVYDVESGNTYTPLLDEKGCAYRKDVLLGLGLFDNETFLNSGEDYDMYMKLKKIGKIMYPDCVVNHDHPGYLSAAGYKKPQNANSWGCLLRRYGTTIPGWWKALLRANIFNWTYFYWFWRGFINKKQDFKRCVE